MPSNKKRQRRSRGTQIRKVSVSIDAVTMAAALEFSRLEGCNLSAALCGMATAFAVKQPVLMAAVNEAVKDAVVERLAETGWSPGVSQMLARELTGQAPREVFRWN